MKIAVYCASTDGLFPEYRESARALGQWIGENGHTLVYGAGSKGLMGIVADAALAAGGKVIGVLPDVAEIISRKHPGLTQTIETKDMAERKNVMIGLSDACVALPGGPGTLDEISDILCLIRLKLYNKPCVLYSVNGYWDSLSMLLTQMTSSGFLKEDELPGVLISDDLAKITEHLVRH